MPTQLRRARRWVWGACAVALLAPAVAMIFSSEVNWGPEDFTLAAILLGTIGVGYEMAVRASSSRTYLLACLLAIVGCVVLIAGNAAVGIVGNESNPINRWFMLVPLSGLIGALWSRFEPAGMSRALVAMTTAQVLASVMVFVLSGAYTFVLMCVFAALWTWAAKLFSAAAAEHAASRAP